MKTIQEIADALTTIVRMGEKAWEATRHPLHSLLAAGVWLVHQETLFIGAAIVGALLWTFGLNAGKKMMQWSIVVYALLCIVLPSV